MIWAITYHIETFATLANFSNFDYFPLKLHELVIGIETIFSALCILDRGEGAYKNYVDQIFDFVAPFYYLLNKPSTPILLLVHEVTFERP